MKKHEPVRRQPYSKPLLNIAAIIEARTNDAECIQELREFLYKSGVSSKEAKRKEND